MESKFTLILGELNHALNNWSWGIYSVKLEVVSGGKFAGKLQTQHSFCSAVRVT